MPSCFAYSALRRGRPNFIASPATMRPTGSPERNRASTSKRMCHPVAPIDTNRRPILCQSVRARARPERLELPLHVLNAPAVLEHPRGTHHVTFGATRESSNPSRRVAPMVDLILPLEQVAEGYRAMDERRAIKALLRP